MTNKITLTLSALLTMALLTTSVAFVPLTSQAHEDHDHEEDTKIEKMEQIVILLEYLRDLLELQIAKQNMSGDMSHDDMDMDHKDDHMDDMSHEGIHIMADGSVMDGDGVTLTDATVNEDGMIVLADGTVVEPVMDMRSDDHMEMEHDEDHEHEDGAEEGVSMSIEIHDGMTHVHYTAEDGTYTEFFVEADIEDEDAIITEAALETGLDEDTVRGLIDFDEVIVWD